MIDLLSELNEQQREAVTSSDGPLLILAGAGSGKTRVIAHRIAYIIAERGVWPRNILAVTFTNKAAEEMRKRANKLLEGLELGSAPLISTFHSLCVRILRRDIEALQAGYTRSFTIYDQDDAVRLTRNCIRDLGFDDKQLAPRSVQSAISAAKNRGEDAEAFTARAQFVDERRASIAAVFQQYEERLQKNNALDFDDLLIKAVRLLRDVQEVRERYNNQFRYLLVDEYQDTNSLQFSLIRLLTEKQQNICVVGDPDQSIYRWRGADITNILKFEEHFPSAKVIRLEENYRSTQNILDVASGLIRHNVQRKEKALWTQNSAGEKIRYYQALDAESEARFVTGKIQEHLRGDRDIRAAVLYRTNSQSRVFEEAMRRSGLSYNIVGGFSFYERMEVRDIIAYLKLAMNQNDSIALQRVINTPTRGIGKMTLDEIDVRARELGVSYWEAITDLLADERRLSPRAAAALANFQRIVKGLAARAESVMAGANNNADADGEFEENTGQGESGGTSPPGREGSRTQIIESSSPVSDLVKAAILDTGYENALKAENNDEAEARLENLQELVNAAVDYDEQGPEGLRDFIDHSALVADTDQYKSDVPVTLMTAHSAKGLEFPLVFIVGLEDGLFPHSRSLSDASDIEEERRLAYVAMTRAEKYLYVTHAVKRRVYGEELASEPSQFLNEMPLDLIEDISRGRSWLSFARESKTIEQAAGSLQYDYDESSGGGPGELSESGNSGRLSARRPGTKFPGKTYDSVESIEEFFRKRAQKMGVSSGKDRGSNATQAKPDPRAGLPNPGGTINSQTGSRSALNADGDARAPSNDILPGSYVRHAKYGRGLVLRREGSGDQTKFTVSFPGYGQKKLIEKYANLEKG
ncbi:MAG: ATP-dependent helicase UvrD/PcrA [Blastocatellia bacterium]|jgi:DNA helicase-2/ATP-dependent DNA helicase PcrA|nr:ATP-dependent helicase UvrD/PcrA [Blastocatellia bacterium]